MKLIFSILVSALLATLSASAVAQEAGEPISPTPRQTELNGEAVEAIIEDEPARAVALLEQARLEGELNIIYLNLGRAYQRLGKCAEAREALAQVSAAPAVADPPAALVDKKAAQYLSELQSECATASAAKPPAEADPAMATRDLWGWVGLGAGLAMAGGGLAFHFAAEAERGKILDDSNYTDGINTTVTQREVADVESRANTLDTVAVGMLVAGGLTAGVGAYLLVTESEESEQQIAVDVLPGGVGMSWTARF